MRMAVKYTPYSSSSKEQTEGIITFSQFEEEGLLSENPDNTESGGKYNDDSIMPPQISEEEMDVMDSGDDYKDEYISTGMSEDIRDGSQSHPSVNIREAHTKIRDCIKRRQS